jgi:hypothetical protein
LHRPLEFFRSILWLILCPHGDTPTVRVMATTPPDDPRESEGSTLRSGRRGATASLPRPSSLTHRADGSAASRPSSVTQRGDDEPLLLPAAPCAPRVVEFSGSVCAADESTLEHGGNAPSGVAGAPTAEGSWGAVDNGAEGPPARVRSSSRESPGPLSNAAKLWFRGADHQQRGPAQMSFGRRRKLDTLHATSGSSILFRLKRQLFHTGRSALHLNLSMEEALHAQHEVAGAVDNGIKVQDDGEDAELPVSEYEGE